MPPKKRGLSDAAPQNKRPKVASRGTVSQPIVLDTQQSLLRLSPRKALVKAAQTADFESQLRESQAVTAPTRRSTFTLQLRSYLRLLFGPVIQAEDAIVAPAEGSEAATADLDALYDMSTWDNDCNTEDN
ncbi:hypothetical protein Ptr902_10484 [Pyrenophora tritici-repentis]|nr:hypothetical protein Ptr902_10484 [Pyrenophora tritici-repentis]